MFTMLDMTNEKTTEHQLLARLIEITEKGITKADMARIAKVTPQAVNGWFKKGTMSKSSAIAVAEAAGVSLAWLLGEAVDEGSGLRKKERELLELFNQLPESEQDNMIAAFSMRLKELDAFVEQYLQKRSKAD